MCMHWVEYKDFHLVNASRKYGKREQIAHDKEDDAENWKHSWNFDEDNNARWDYDGKQKLVIRFRWQYK